MINTTDAGNTLLTIRLWKPRHHPPLLSVCMWFLQRFPKLISKQLVTLCPHLNFYLNRKFSLAVCAGTSQVLSHTPCLTFYYRISSRTLKNKNRMTNSTVDYLLVKQDSVNATLDF